MTNDLYVYMEFVIVQLCLECLLDKNKTLNDNICLIQKMIPLLRSYDLNDIIIYEKYTSIHLDPHILLDELGLYDGISIIIF